MENQNRKKSYWSWGKVAAITGASTLVAIAAWRLTRIALGSILTGTPGGTDEELPNVVDGAVSGSTETQKLDTSPSEGDSLTCLTQPCHCQSSQGTITLEGAIEEDIDNQRNNGLTIAYPSQVEDPARRLAHSCCDRNSAQETNTLEGSEEDEKNEPKQNGIIVKRRCQVQDSTESLRKSSCDYNSFQKSNALEGSKEDEDKGKKKKSKKQNRCPPLGSIPPPTLSNLNALLADIYRRHIALRDEDFGKYYAIFNEVFAVLQTHMKAVDSYYKQYNSRKQLAGSHADKLRIGRPDEFDIDVVIRIPLDNEEASNPAESDLVLEPQVPGHVRLRGGKQYASLHLRDNWEINKTAFKWCDDKKYILRSKFTDWFKSVVRRALNELPKGPGGLPTVEINDKFYQLSTRESGPACTLIVQRDDGFRLDVDLVPALKFSEARWPPNSDYRKIPQGCESLDWLVVPKAARGAEDALRSWRVSLYAQEKRLMDNQQRMRQAIRMIKKLRDTLEMKEIASYYIKTLFLWERTERNDSKFWNQSESAIFKAMVRKLYEAIRDQEIPYFWNKKNNLIGHVSPRVLDGYRAKLEELVQALEAPRVPLDAVARFLLTPTEFEEYRNYFNFNADNSD